MWGKVTVMIVMIRVRVEVTDVIWRRDGGVVCSSLVKKKRQKEKRRV